MYSWHSEQSWVRISFSPIRRLFIKLRFSNFRYGPIQRWNWLTGYRRWIQHRKRKWRGNKREEKDESYKYLGYLQSWDIDQQRAKDTLIKVWFTRLGFSCSRYSSSKFLITYFINKIRSTRKQNICIYELLSYLFDSLRFQQPKNCESIKVISVLCICLAHIHTYLLLVCLLF